MVLGNFRLAVIFTCPRTREQEEGAKKEKKGPAHRTRSPQSTACESMGMIPSSTVAKGLLCVVLSPVLCCVLIASGRVSTSALG